MSGIEFEQTPNPDALRVLPGRIVSEGGPRQYDRGAAAADPLAAELLALPGVARVMLGREFVTVVRLDASVDWKALRPEIALTLLDWLDRPAPSQPAAAPRAVHDGAVGQQIEAVLDRHVRPRLAADGGDAVLVRYDPADGTAWVRMEGACGGCPSGSMTLKQGIARTIRHWVPEVRRVAAEAETLAEKVDPKARFRDWVAAKWGTKAG
ncbi:NifU family protein [Sphingomonas sp. ac-8]|uniref:NifU family protein n=1 Tax=Sphingomonas sp. ac-8 TaxID=3242977 RepID=UPI003A80A337